MFLFWGKVLQNIVDSGLRGASGVATPQNENFFLLKRVFAQNMVSCAPACHSHLLINTYKRHKGGKEVAENTDVGPE